MLLQPPLLINPTREEEKGKNLRLKKVVEKADREKGKVENNES